MTRTRRRHGTSSIGPLAGPPIGPLPRDWRWPGPARGPLNRKSRVRRYGWHSRRRPNESPSGSLLVRTGTLRTRPPPAAAGPAGPLTSSRVRLARRMPRALTRVSQARAGPEQRRLCQPETWPPGPGLRVAHPGPGGHPLRVPAPRAAPTGIMILNRKIRAMFPTLQARDSEMMACTLRDQHPLAMSAISTLMSHESVCSGWFCSTSAPKLKACAESRCRLGIAEYCNAECQKSY